ncbi:hypothetical protein RvY_09878 [Ramazzottius varieornatus]|uniref:Probable imidazolonepropionase n=1 Tax=Ramazzottius varieornatus TaxID=947166 RepID=A0A1D1VJV0_RAMVA|nr:hypothetical protein RvY_09878 [Ramazzottius varieornatus]
MADSTSSTTAYSKPFKLLVRSAEQVVQVVNNGAKVLRGNEMKSLAVLESRLPKDANRRDGLSVVVDRTGNIHDIGYDSDLDGKYTEQDFDHIVDATGQCVIPGLIDGHTHPVWAGDRVNEFSMKLAGATYMDIHKAGGGIYSTVTSTHLATEEQLYSSLVQRLQTMLQNGSTTIEAKSGYGLDLENELKILRVLHRAQKEGPWNLSITYCGAHAVPKGSSAEVAVKDIVEHHLNAVMEETKAGRLTVDNVDVFCETGVFTVEQAKAILRKGQSFGLNANFHAEELSYLGGAEMGAAIGSKAISHLEYISPEGIAAIAQSGTVATLLPTTAFQMRLPAPPVRRMIEQGVAVAIGSDFNPNAHCLSMPVVMYLAAVTFHMSLEEVLAASTINAAASLNLADSRGSLEIGKVADMVLIDSPSWEHLIYQLGNATKLISTVISKGFVVRARKKE